jgi:hypothetical protein
VDRRHGPFFDADPFFDQYVHDGRQAIGGAELFLAEALKEAL